MTNAFNWREFTRPTEPPKAGFCRCGCGKPVKGTWAQGHATKALPSAEQSRRRTVRMANGAKE